MVDIYSITICKTTMNVLKHKSQLWISDNDSQHNMLTYNNIHITKWLILVQKHVSSIYCAKCKDWHKLCSGRWTYILKRYLGRGGDEVCWKHENPAMLQGYCVDTKYCYLTSEPMVWFLLWAKVKDSNALHIVSIWFIFCAK